MTKTSKEGKIVFLIPTTGQLGLNHDENCEKSVISIIPIRNSCVFERPISSIRNMQTTKEMSVSATNFHHN
jgi:hypothetical protein